MSTTFYPGWKRFLRIPEDQVAEIKQHLIRSF
jgi:hypothetical protein